MYYFGFVSLALIVFVQTSAELTDFQAIAMIVGALFANITGWLHSQRQISESKYTYLISKLYADASGKSAYSGYIGQAPDGVGKRVLVDACSDPRLIVRSQEIPDERLTIEIIRFSHFDAATNFAVKKERLSTLHRHNIEHASWVVTGKR